MKNAPTIINPTNPAIVDRVLIDFNTKMLNKLDWLTGAYGKAQVLTRKDDKKKIIKYPAIYTGTGKEYASMLPNESYGNFSFWDMQKAYDIDWIGNQMQVIEAEFGLIVWFNINKVLEADQKRSLESIKEEMMDVFVKTRVLNARIKLTGITEKNEEIYKGYSIKEHDQQYLMHPFGALRFNGEMRIEKLCNS